MYHVTLVNLAPDARRADVNLGAGESRVLPAEELGALLENFRGLDPLENAGADPEIRLRHRGARYLVRTGQGRLLFKDETDAARPTVALTVEEILAELDGSAAAARSPSSGPAGSGPNAGAVSPPIEPVTPAKRRARWIVLWAVAALLLGGVAALYLQRERPAEPGFVALAPAELADVASQVAGVYVTGSEPGDRSLVIGADGAIRIFELTAGGAPNFVHGTWRAGRIDGTLHLAVPQFRTFARIVDRDTLDYCGEQYRRATAL